MPVSSIKSTICAPLERVWDAVTDAAVYGWRSDLSRTEILGENRFIEYSPGNYATYFTVASCIPGERWELDMENTNMRGHWAGMFRAEGEVTCVEFTENVTAKKFYLRPFVRSYLKRQQSRFIADLKAHLEKGSL